MTRRTTGIALTVGGGALVAVLVSCAALFPLDDLTGSTAADSGIGTADSSEDAAHDAAPDVLLDAASSACPDGGGPTMIAAGPFCVDATEVTNAEYLAFVNAKGTDAGGQDPFCSWNVDWTPSCWPFPVGAEAAPVTCVDWCDAWAFCAWAGKRLCGRIGGGPTSSDEFVTAPENDQWYAACSHAGARRFPYGDAYEPSTCNGFDLGKNKALNVASLPGCEGGYAGVFDMSGNVYEWVDSCQQAVGAGDSCFVRGGSYRYDEDGGRLDCKGSPISRIPRNSQFGDTGFRCCAP